LCGGAGGIEVPFFLLIILALLLLSKLFDQFFPAFLWLEEIADHFYSKASRKVSLYGISQQATKHENMWAPKCLIAVTYFS
jgi:hypothetical protein